jgi:hypothetical protein
MDLSDAYAPGVHRQSLPRVNGHKGILLTDRALSGREAAATGGNELLRSVQDQRSHSVINMQDTFFEQFSPVEWIPAIIGDDLKWSSLAKPVDVAEEHIERHLRPVCQDGFRLSEKFEFEIFDHLKRQYEMPIKRRIDPCSDSHELRIQLSADLHIQQCSASFVNRSHHDVAPPM